MARFGVFLLVMAIGSLVLHQFGMEFILLAWVDLWGTEIGWIIRGAMAVVGVALILIERHNGGPD